MYFSFFPFFHNFYSVFLSETQRAFSSVIYSLWGRELRFEGDEMHHLLGHGVSVPQAAAAAVGAVLVTCRPIYR